MQLDNKPTIVISSNTFFIIDTFNFITKIINEIKISNTQFFIFLIATNAQMRCYQYIYVCILTRVFLTKLSDCQMPFLQLLAYCLLEACGKCSQYAYERYG